MVTKEEIKFESEIQENTFVEEIQKQHTDSVLVWIAASGCNDIAPNGEYNIIIQLNDYCKFFSGSIAGATANQTFIHAAIFAIKQLSKPNRVCVITPTALGFEGAFKGKGVNAKLLNELLEEIVKAQCTLTEIQYIGGSNKIKNFIEKNSDGKYNHYDADKSNYAKTYKEKVIEVLEANNVDSDIIEMIKRI